jgi:hypothetical protein
MHRPPRFIVALLVAAAAAGASAAPAVAQSVRGEEMSHGGNPNQDIPEVSNRPAGAGTGRKIG